MISAIVLAYNRCAEVLITIEKLKQIRVELPFDLEIVVVDNASADDTTPQIKAAHPDIVLVTKKTNNGIAGWNEGFAIAKNRYFLVLDDDSHPYNGLVEAVERLENNPDIGILPFQIKDVNLGTDPLLDPEEAWKDNEDVAGFIGCGAIIRKSLYEKIGGFAEWIYLYTHEFEYAIRCLNAGYRINFFGKGVVIHRVSSLNRSNKRLRVYSTRNELLIIYKYFKNDKAKYLFRIFINHLKFIRREGMASGYYVWLGFYEFLKKKKSLKKTPVAVNVQEYFANNFWSTKPIFSHQRKQAGK